MSIADSLANAVRAAAAEIGTAGAARLAAELKIAAPSKRWIYGDDNERATPFVSHKCLDALEWTADDDPGLAVQPGDEWIGAHYYVGDHRGCQCRFSSGQIRDSVVVQRLGDSGTTLRWRASATLPDRLDAAAVALPRRGGMRIQVAICRPQDVGWFEDGVQRWPEVL